MINFDEEIKKFHPALEIGDVEDAIREENAVQDLTEMMQEIMAKKAPRASKNLTLEDL